MDRQVAKGAVDLFGPEAAAMRRCTDALERVFVRHGGVPLETPVFENRETLTGKYGEEASQLVFDISANGGHPLVLRYDHTIPMIRFVRERGLKTLRRYAIGKVYRRDCPNATQGRFREFYQADFDVVGEPSEEGGAELLALAVASEAFRELGIADYTILVNTTDRLRAAVQGVAGIPDDMFRTVCASIDKLDKMSWDALVPELEAKGLAPTEIVSLKAALHSTPDPPEWTELLGEHGIDPSKVRWCPWLARGLDYYDGLIFEIKLGLDGPSVAAGGQYAMGGVTGVGFSVGLTRLMRLTTLGSPPETWRDRYEIVFVGQVGARDRARAIGACRAIAGDAPVTWPLAPSTRTKLHRALSGAAARHTRFVAIAGEDEVRRGKMTVRDLREGTQRLVDL